MFGPSPDADPDFHVTLHHATPHVMQFTGGHTIVPGDAAYWTATGSACPVPPAPPGAGGVLDASLQMTATLTAGTYELCLVQGGVVVKHGHVLAIVVYEPPSTPPASPPPSPPHPLLPLPSPPPPSCPSPLPPPPSPPPAPPPHIVLDVVFGPSPDADPDFHVTLHHATPHVMQFTGGHTIVPGDAAYWTATGSACPVPPAPPGAGGVLDASLQMTATLTAGTYELCLVQGGVVVKHGHVLAIVVYEPPSTPPASPPPSPPHPLLPLLSPPPLTIALPLPSPHSPPSFVAPKYPPSLPIVLLASSNQALNTVSEADHIEPATATVPVLASCGVAVLVLLFIGSVTCSHLRTSKPAPIRVEVSASQKFSGLPASPCAGMLSSSPLTTDVDHACCSAAPHDLLDGADHLDKTVAGSTYQGSQPLGLHDIATPIIDSSSHFAHSLPGVSETSIREKMEVQIMQELSRRVEMQRVLVTPSSTSTLPLHLEREQLTPFTPLDAAITGRRDTACSSSVPSSNEVSDHLCTQSGIMAYNDDGLISHNICSSKTQQASELQTRSSGGSRSVAFDLVHSTDEGQEQIYTITGSSIEEGVSAHICRAKPGSTLAPDVPPTIKLAYVDAVTVPDEGLERFIMLPHGSTRRLDNLNRALVEKNCIGQMILPNGMLFYMGTNDEGLIFLRTPIRTPNRKLRSSKKPAILALGRPPSEDTRGNGSGQEVALKPTTSPSLQPMAQLSVSTTTAMAVNRPSTQCATLAVNVVSATQPTVTSAPLLPTLSLFSSPLSAPLLALSTQDAEPTCSPPTPTPPRMATTTTLIECNVQESPVGMLPNSEPSPPPILSTATCIPVAQVAMLQKTDGKGRNLLRI